MANYDGILYLRSKHCASGLPAAEGRWRGGLLLTSPSGQETESGHRGQERQATGSGWRGGPEDEDPCGCYEPGAAEPLPSVSLLSLPQSYHQMFDAGRGRHAGVPERAHCHVRNGQSLRRGGRGRGPRHVWEVGWGAPTPTQTSEGGCSQATWTGADAQHQAQDPLLGLSPEGPVSEQPGPPADQPPNPQAFFHCVPNTASLPHPRGSSCIPRTLPPGWDFTRTDQLPQRGEKTSSTTWAVPLKRPVTCRSVSPPEACWGETRDPKANSLRDTTCHNSPVRTDLPLYQRGWIHTL